MHLYSTIDSPKLFEALVHRLFDAESRVTGSELHGFQVVSSDRRGDRGVDGFLPSGTVFQVYYPLPERLASTPMADRERKKIRDTCSKIAKHRDEVKQTIGTDLAKLVFVIPRDPDWDIIGYCRDKAAKKLGQIEVEVWGFSRLSNLLQAHRTTVADLVPLSATGDDVAALLREADRSLETGDTDEAVNRASEALVQALLRGDEAQQCGSLLRLADAYVQENDLDAFRRVAERAYECAGSLSGHPGLVSGALRSLAEAKLRSGDPSGARMQAIDALQVAEDGGLRRHMALSHYQLGWIALAQEDLAEAQHHAEACAAWLAREDLTEPEAYADLEAAVAFAAGNHDTAVDAARRSAESYERQGNKRLECLVRRRQAEFLAEAGHLDEALDVCNEFERSATLEPSDPLLLEMDLLRARLLVAVGQADAASVLSDSLRERAEEADAARMAGEAALLVGEICLRSGEHARAMASARVAYAAFGRASVGQGQFNALRLEAAAHHAGGALDEAQSRLQTAVEFAEASGLPSAATAAGRLGLAAVHLEVGRYDEAADVLSPIPPSVAHDVPELGAEIARVRQETKTAQEVRQGLINAVDTDQPLHVAGTGSAASLNEAHAQVLRPLLEWTEVWPEAHAGILDFWGRGNFVRVALNHRGFTHAFHLTVEVATVDEARRAVRCLSPLADCLTLLWKGGLHGSLGIVPMHVEYDGPGGWGYAACAGDQMRPSDDSPWDWCPAMGFGNYLPHEVAEFFLSEARPLVADGRLVLLPAPLVGCISRQHGALERLFSHLVRADPVLQPEKGSSEAREAISMAFPYFPAAPLADLAQFIVDEQESLRKMRRVLVRLSAHLTADGCDLSPTIRREFIEEVEDGLEEVRRRFEDVKRRLAPSGQFETDAAHIRGDAISVTEAGVAPSTDQAANALTQIAAVAELRRDPWYALWRMEQKFGRRWQIGGPALPSAGPPPTEDATPEARKEARRYYHWLHPPQGGWTVPTVAVPR